MSSTPFGEQTRLDGTRIAESFLEVVDVFTDLIDRDRFITVLLRCAEISGVKEGAILLSDGNGGLSVAVASCGAVLSLLDDGRLPGRDSFVSCLRDGVPVLSEYHPAEVPYDPFVGQALNLGFHNEYLFPVSFRGAVLGAVALLDHNEMPIDPWRADATGSLALTAGVMMHHARTHESLAGLVGQLQSALEARAVIEQAKGVLAERNGHDMDSAFRDLRTKARSERRPIIDVARGIVPQG